MLLLPDTIQTLDGVIAFFGRLSWRVQDLEGGGRSAFAVLGRNPATKDIVVMACIEGGTTPLHEHTDGEVIHTWAGQLEWRDGHGVVVHTPFADPIELESRSQHAPRATFWLGVYRQPKGSTIVE